MQHAMLPQRPLGLGRTRLAQRRALRVTAGIQTGSSARVKGHARAVFNYVSDFSNLPAWYPDVSGVVVTRGSGKPVGVRHQYEAQQKIASFQLPVLYEVVEFQQDKKIVLSVGSDLHHGTEQLVFMPCPNDPGYTIVRHMSHVELMQWRKAFQPWAAGAFTKLSEQGMSQLAALLSSAQSPLRSAKGGSASYSRSGSQGGAWNFANMFANLKNDMGSDSAYGNGRTSAAAHAAQRAAQVDALGYYAALGLDGKRSRKLSAEQIKTAFRRVAITMHPDKFNLAAEEEKLVAEEAFKKVQRAYEVLKNPDTRKAYDDGRLQSLEQPAEEASYA